MNYSRSWRDWVEATRMRGLFRMKREIILTRKIVPPNPMPGIQAMRFEAPGFFAPPIIFARIQSSLVYHNHFFTHLGHFFARHDSIVFQPPVWIQLVFHTLIFGAGRNSSPSFSSSISVTIVADCAAAADTASPGPVVAPAWAVTATALPRRRRHSSRVDTRPRPNQEKRRAPKHRALP